MRLRFAVLFNACSPNDPLSAIVSLSTTVSDAVQGTVFPELTTNPGFASNFHDGPTFVQNIFAWPPCVPNAQVTNCLFLTLVHWSRSFPPLTASTRLGFKADKS